MRSLMFGEKRYKKKRKKQKGVKKEIRDSFAALAYSFAYVD